MSNDMTKYLSGAELYGDDFTPSEIEAWFADEAEGYANLGAKIIDDYRYVYHELNKRHGFKFIHRKKLNNVLGIGSAYGEEFKPIADLISKVSILDPSDAFSETRDILGIPCEYIKPNPSGNMEFESNQFDLITCLGSMHHIPNVSHVIGECYRCLDNQGMMLIREPILSMGDWTKPRNGLTKRERGIPLNILRGIIRDTGFRVRHESFCMTPLLAKYASKANITAYNNYAATLVDAFLSKVFAWNIRYQRREFHEKFAPASVYYVLEK